MSLFLPPTTQDLPSFVRKVASAVNSLLRGNVFPASATAPPDPQLGTGWFNTATNKAMVYDGTSWQPLW